MGNNRQKRKKTKVKHNHNILYFTKGEGKLKSKLLNLSRRQLILDTKHDNTEGGRIWRGNIDKGNTVGTKNPKRRTSKNHTGNRTQIKEKKLKLNIVRRRRQNRIPELNLHTKS